MSTATFLQQDTATQGTWYSGATPLYGADGYGIIGNAASSNNSSIPVTQGYFNYPAYATVSLASESAFCWQNSSSNAAAVEYAPPGASSGSDTKRVVAAWANASGFTLDISDGDAHQIALYFQDLFHTNQRTESVTITDDNNGNALLDSRTVSNFTNGVWLVWNVSGKVTFTIDHISGDNAVLSGIFFDPATITPAVFPPFVSRPRFEPAHYE